MSAIDDCREMGLLPEEAKRWHDRRQMYEREAEELHMGPYPRDIDYYAIESLAAALLEQKAETEKWADRCYQTDEVKNAALERADAAEEERIEYVRKYEGAVEWAEREKTRADSLKNERDTLETHYAIMRDAMHEQKARADGLQRQLDACEHREALEKARADKAEAMLREHWRLAHDYNCTGRSVWGQTCEQWLAALARRTGGDNA